jgi:hypothetical protein
MHLHAQFRSLIGDGADHCTVAKTLEEVSLEESV